MRGAGLRGIRIRDTGLRDITDEKETPVTIDRRPALGKRVMRPLAIRAR